MTEKKKIVINRDFLSLTKKRKKKKPKWHKPKLNTNSLKKKLINKIKKYKNDQNFQNPQIHNEFMNKKENNNNNNIKPKLVDDDFKSTLQTMDNIIKQRREKKRLKKEKKRLRKERRLQKKLQKKINSEKNKVDCENNTININKFISDIKDASSIPIYNNNLNNGVNNTLNNNQNNNQIKSNIKFSINNNNNRNKNTNRNEITNIKNEISIHTKKNENIKLNKEPLWGCLKNGKKPTFKQYKKSLKMKKEKIKISNTINHENNLSNDLNNNNNNLVHNNNNNPLVNTNREKIEIRKNKLVNLKNKTKRLTKTMKRWKLGKINNYVGVLIKSKKIRNMINKDIKTIRKTPVKQAKDYLYKRNLLKQGSQAPNDVVKIIYENSLLSGDIYNTNPETLLHNFINANN